MRGGASESETRAVSLKLHDFVEKFENDYGLYKGWIWNIFLVWEVWEINIAEGIIPEWLNGNFISVINSYEFIDF